jgi:hypothetical protein
MSSARRLGGRRCRPIPRGWSTRCARHGLYSRRGPRGDISIPDSARPALMCRRPPTRRRAWRNARLPSGGGPCIARTTLMYATWSASARAAPASIACSRRPVHSQSSTSSRRANGRATELGGCGAGSGAADRVARRRAGGGEPGRLRRGPARSGIRGLRGPNRADSLHYCWCAAALWPVTPMRRTALDLCHAAFIAAAVP